MYVLYIYKQLYIYNIVYIYYYYIYYILYKQFIYICIYIYKLRTKITYLHVMNFIHYTLYQLTKQRKKTAYKMKLYKKIRNLTSRKM